MICAIAIIFGCYDLGTLVLMFIVNAVMNLLGLLMERMNPPERSAVDWTPFVFGCIAGAAPWIVVLPNPNPNPYPNPDPNPNPNPNQESFLADDELARTALSIRDIDEALTRRH